MGIFEGMPEPEPVFEGIRRVVLELDEGWYEWLIEQGASEAQDGETFTVVSVEEMHQARPEGCALEYVATHVVGHHDRVRITEEGDVEVRGDFEVDDINGDTYLWCDTHQVRIHSGDTHEGVTLGEDWETI